MKRYTYVIVVLSSTVKDDLVLAKTEHLSSSITGYGIDISSKPSHDVIESSRPLFCQFRDRIYYEIRELQGVAYSDGDRTFLFGPLQCALA